ncbi:hypothetical protein C4K26_2140 [Pseudomonas chlororaphis]|uniref:hypothetical protein n=1 Tax=Pseudomonas chlororaphis TaxID=587753 RepID=UPI000F567D59|nr:hypothetical protein [Pseudomonas chlororaphis]AZD07543.1 hypothetical protein C4K26_2140 [Pseudomonas chlororaphis]
MNHTELKRLAEAAPEGPWFGPEYAPGTSYVFDVDLGSLLHYESIDTEQDACLRYVAAANPAAVLALIAEIETLKAGFKNFHRSLCERFGYYHDDIDWQRDQASLEEHIATQFNHVSAENSSLRSQMETVQRGAGQLKAENEALRKERDKLAEDNQGLLEDFAGCL